MTRSSAIKPLAKPYLATIALLSVAMAWGAAFVVMKPAINEQPFYDFLATRYSIDLLYRVHQGFCQCQAYLDFMV